MFVCVGVGIYVTYTQIHPRTYSVRRTCVRIHGL